MNLTTRFSSGVNFIKKLNERLPLNLKLSNQENRELVGLFNKQKHAEKKAIEKALENHEVAQEMYEAAVARIFENKKADAVDKLHLLTASAADIPDESVQLCISGYLMEIYLVDYPNEEKAAKIAHSIRYDENLKDKELKNIAHIVACAFPQERKF
jgi:hypothetical protein